MRTVWTRPVGRREEALMALVVCDMSISLDGYVTGPNDSRENPFGDGAGMLHDWMFDAATGDDRAILQEMVDGAGTHECAGDPGRDPHRVPCGPVGRGLSRGAVENGVSPRSGRRPALGDYGSCPISMMRTAR